MGIAIVVLSLILVMLLGGWRLFRRASNERDWKPDVAFVTKVKRDGDVLQLSHVRNNRYGEPGSPYDIVWEERQYDLSKLKRLWFVIEPFHPTIEAIAHTFLSFEFEDDFLALSVEARTQRDESYSIAKGLVGEYEMTYLFGDERDFILRRTSYMERSKLYMYPLVTPPHEVKALLINMVSLASELVERPRFYHSIVENCTSSLKVHANKVRPGSFPVFVWAQVLPGRSDKVLYDKGWIDSDLPFEVLRESFNVADIANTLKDDDAFSSKLRQQLQLRQLQQAHKITGVPLQGG